MFRLGLIQMLVTHNKEQNLRVASERIRLLAKNGANIVALPECFNSPYGSQYFEDYAEKIPDGPTTDALKMMARDNCVYLVGGSIPEVEHESNEKKYYNTCSVIDPEGHIIAKHRKVHLFDIDIPGKISFKESDVLSAGSNITMFETPYGKMSVGICYDIRFPELAMISARNGCRVMIYPGAFNMTTGPLHWELLARARAVDNQIFVALVSPARDESAHYVAWGNSLVVDPNGGVVEHIQGGEEGTLLSIIDFRRVDECRSNIPITIQRRFDVYPDISKH